MGLLICLFVLAAVLPIIGFGRLLWRSQVELNRANRLVSQRGKTGATNGDINHKNDDITKEPREERNAVIWDISLVGLGLVAGGVASIWALVAV